MSDDAQAKMIDDIKAHYRAQYKRSNKSPLTPTRRWIENAGFAASIFGLAVCIMLPALGVVVAPALGTAGALAMLVGYTAIYNEVRIRDNIAQKDAKTAENALQADIDSGVLLDRYKKEVVAPEVLSLRNRLSALRKMATSFNASAQIDKDMLSPDSSLRSPKFVA